MTQEGLIERRIRSHMSAERSAMTVPANLERTILRAIDSAPAAVSRQPSWRRIALRVALVVLALALATPARTFAGETLQRVPFGAIQRFGTVLIDPAKLFRNESKPPPKGLRAPVASSPKLSTPNLSLAEAQRQVDFPIHTPSWLPQGVVFRGALVGPDGSVVVSYRAANDPSRGMFVQMQRGASAGGYAIPASAAQNVLVNGRPAVYAHGSWDESRNWSGGADAALLSWEDSGFTYVFSCSGLGLSRDDVIRIANSLR